MEDVFDMETTKERIEYIRSLSEVEVYLELLWALGELKELKDRLQVYDRLEVYEDEEISANLEGTYEEDEEMDEVIFDEEDDEEEDDFDFEKMVKED